MPKGRSRMKGKRLSAHANIWYCDDITQEHYGVVVEYYMRVKHCESAAACTRLMVNETYERIMAEAKPAQ